MTNEKLYTKPTEEEYDEVKELTKTNKKILKYSILTIIMILVTIMHFATIVNMINSTLNFTLDTIHYIFVENINTIKQLVFVTFILLTNALLLIHVKTLKHVTFKRHRPNYLKKYTNTKFWGTVYSVITLPLLYLIYGTFTQFLTILLVVGIPVSIYTYIEINNIEKLYPKLPPQKKEVMMKNIEDFKNLKNKLKKHFGNARNIFYDKKQLNELNIVLNFHKFIVDYNKHKQYEDIIKKTNRYILESTRSNEKYDELDEKEFWKYHYDNARDDIDFNKLKEILKKNNIPIINYIRFNYSHFNESYKNHNRFHVKLKKSIFY